MQSKRGSSRLRGKLKTGSKVWVELDSGNAKHQELLVDMDLVDAHKAVLQGIMMQGTIQSKQANTYEIYLDAALESFHFSHEKTTKVTDLAAPKDHYTVVDGKVVKVRGLKFSYPNRPVTYHLRRADAVAELKYVRTQPTGSSQSNANTSSRTSQPARSLGQSTTTTDVSATTSVVSSGATSVTTTTVATSTTTSVASSNATSVTTTMAVTSGATSETTTAVESVNDVSATTPTNVVSVATRKRRSSRGRSTRKKRKRGRGRGAGGDRSRARANPYEGIPELVDCPDSSSSESESEDELSGEDGGTFGEVMPEHNDPIDLTNDFITDDEEEAASDHEDAYLQWDQPGTWAKDREVHPIFAELGETRWRMPSDRGSCATQDSGPHQDPRFLVKVQDRNYLKLFLDALPVVTFWFRIVVFFSKQRAQDKTRPVVHNSPQCTSLTTLSHTSLTTHAHHVHNLRTQHMYHSHYSRTQHSDGESHRSFDPALITVANYLRVIAAVIMRGLVKCRDESSFFKDEKRGKHYVRIGAEKVIGLTLNQYQALIRFLALASQTDRPKAHTNKHDKCWFVRALIKFLQLAFVKWFMPGKDNAMDEAGVPSRFRWLRNFNKDKPHKYYIELLMACCSITKFCWHFFVNESSKKVVRNPRRSRNGRGKKNRAMFNKYVHYQPEYDAEDRKNQDILGPSAAQILYFARHLRTRDMGNQNDMSYRVFVDRRWGNLAGIVASKRRHNVSYTATVCACMIYICVCSSHT